MPLPVAREGSFATSSDILLPSAARTASGTSDQFYADPITAAVVEVNVTAASGTTPTLSLALEDSFDGVTWNKVADVNAAAITTSGVTVKRLNLVDVPTTGRLRVSYTVGGTTPSFTFTVKVYAIRGI